MTQYTRQGDGGGRLRVTVDDDGDVHLAINPAPGQSGIEFCTRMGGGRSPAVLKALRSLAKAIEAENLGTHPGLA